MLQDFLQVDLLGAGVQKRCAPPFVHAPPLCLVVPHPRPHLGAHRIPAPHFRTPAPLVRSILCLGCASPSSHTLRASTVCFLGCTAHHSVPPPLVCGPLACGPPLTRGASHAVPLRAALPCHVPSLRVAPSVQSSPCAHPCPSCTSGMHAKGRAGVVGHPNGRCDPDGGDCHEREGGTPSLVPPWHVCKGGGEWVGRGEARRVVTRGTGVA